MKKLFASLFVLAFLASCNGATTSDQTGNNTAKTSGNICEAYTSYLQCTYKKSGIDESTAEQTLKQAKSAFESLPADQQKATCQQLVDAVKQAPMVDGCSL